ncbi:hyaluronan and proteoglycan link protein 3-like [Trichomycterus rosablanca]|uniref:hyaluronan and proteoglycan link protein 3-like n=1 Tax=Trichomycterus rosablanca TaxID=2290929 RepID=UPI002F35EB50
MMEKVQVLLLSIIQLLYWSHTVASSSSGFFYQDIMNSSANRDIHLSGVRLRVQAQPCSVFTVRGANATLPCHFWHEPPLTSPRSVRVKWSWVPVSGGRELDVLVVSGRQRRSFGDFRDRVHLQRELPGDVSLVITDVGMNDGGRYRCQVIDGLEDESVAVELGLRGVVFPYQPHCGRYHLTFVEAQQACEDQDAVIATSDQLYAAWQEGLNCCNAGWLADGTVQYPITKPRHQCGGTGVAPGVRSYGARHRQRQRFDVFCFTSPLRGRVYFLQPPLSFSRAGQACAEDGAQIAKVGQLFAAWRFQDLDRCEAGWLADGSLRYPIAHPRPHCGPREPGVRSFGFPPAHHEHGVYCFGSR